jgi:hypothetical protein
VQQAHRAARNGEGSGDRGHSLARTASLRRTAGKVVVGLPDGSVSMRSCAVMPFAPASAHGRLIPRRFPSSIQPNRNSETPRMDSSAAGSSSSKKRRGIRRVPGGTNATAGGGKVVVGLPDGSVSMRSCAVMPFALRAASPAPSVVHSTEPQLGDAAHGFECSRLIEQQGGALEPFHGSLVCLRSAPKGRRTSATKRQQLRSTFRRCEPRVRLRPSSIQPNRNSETPRMDSSAAGSSR